MPRQFVFRYNGEASSEETEQDLDDSMSVPETGSVYPRKGKLWCVAAVQTTASINAGGSIPIVRVFLTHT
jgi:hypothetical protein